MPDEDEYPENTDLHAHLREYGVIGWDSLHAACERHGIPHQTGTPVMRADIIKLLHALKKESERDA